MKKLFTIIMIMVMVLTNVPMTTEAKTKASITVINKSTGKKVGKKLSLKKGQKVQLKVKYGKKTVTKKAKYKTSAKTVATVSKKGKITAKSAGTCTVKVTYKKKTKKITITVKAPKIDVPITESTEQPATESASKKKQPIEKYLDSCKIETSPHPECNHVWRATYRSDVFITESNFAELAFDHLYLDRLYCSKCDAIALTKPIPVTEALYYTNEELNNSITCYIAPGTGEENAPKHKHNPVQQFYPIPNDPYGRWSVSEICSLCNDLIP